jgi:hypothetical protein
MKTKGEVGMEKGREPEEGRERGRKEMRGREKERERMRECSTHKWYLFIQNNARLLFLAL